MPPALSRFFNPGREIEDSFAETQRILISQYEEERLRENTHVINPSNLISPPHGRQCKVVKKFRVGDVHMAVITEFRAIKAGSQRMFYVKRLNEDQTAAISGQLPYELEHCNFGSIKHAVQNARRLLAHG